MNITLKNRLKKFTNYVPLFFTTTLLSGCLETVPYVDIKRYSGLWYEIASYPSTFSTNLVGTTATYGLLGDGTVSVLNQAFKASCDGEPTQISGYAIAEDATNSKLSVKLEIAPGIFTNGNYWIIALDEKNYSYAVVSEPTMQNLFILNRQPHMDEKLLNAIIKALTFAGFDEERIQLTPQCT